MMVVILFVIFLIVSVRRAKKNNDFFHPLVLYFFPFFVQYIVYLIMYRSNNPVSQTTLFIYTSSIIVFITFYCFFENHFLRSTQIYDKYVIVVEPSLLRIIGAMTIISLTIEIGSSVLSRGLDGAYRYMRYNVNYGEGLSFFSKYLPVLYNTAFIAWITNVISEKKIKKKKKDAIIYSVLFFVIAFFSFSRTNLLMALCAFSYCVLQNPNNQIENNKNKLSKIVFIIISIAIIMYVFSWIANATNKMGDADFNSSDYYVWKYVGYPLVTMDKYTTSYPGITSGLFSLGIIGKLLNSAGLLHTGDLSVLPITGQFNVYSYIGNVYLDFGAGYFIAQIFIAIIVAYIYTKNKCCHGIWTVLYAFYSYAILISFYSYQYSLTLYIYIFILLCMLQKKNVEHA